MTPRQADKTIKDGQPVTCRVKPYHDVLTITFVSRDRWNISTADGQLFDRDDVVLLTAV